MGKFDEYCEGFKDNNAAVNHQNNDIIDKHKDNDDELNIKCEDNDMDEKKSNILKWHEHRKSKICQKS